MTFRRYIGAKLLLAIVALVAFALFAPETVMAQWRRRDRGFDRFGGGFDRYGNAPDPWGNAGCIIECRRYTDHRQQLCCRR